MATTWQGTADTDYYNSANWTAGSPYGSSPDDAVIGTGAPTPYTITVMQGDSAGPPATYAANTLTLNDSQMTLSLGGYSFTVALSTTFTAGTITLQGGELDFGADNTTTFGSGAYVTGFGLVTNDLSGSGTFESSGGLLELNLNIGGAMTFKVAAGSTTQFDGNVASTVNVAFEANSGSIVLYDESAFQGTISGLVEVANTGASAQNYLVEGYVVDPSLATFDYTTDILMTDAGSIQLAGTYTSDTVLRYAADTNGYGGYDFWLAVCFAEGTRILTDRGEVAVESLTDADTVIIVDRGTTTTMPVRWVGHRHLDLTNHAYAQHAAPVRIRHGAFAENLPQRDLIVSPDHCLFVDGKLIPAKLLINGMTIVQETAAKSVTYYHVELDRHAVLLAEGLPAESYLDTGNRAFFSNAGLALILHPEFHVNAGLQCWDTDACAPLAVSEAAVMPVWNTLAARAETLGFELPEILTTDDADLRIVAAGRTFRPVSSNANRFVFVLPAGVTQAELLSRAGSPADVKPWLEDHRQLGVAVSRIVVRGGADYAEVPVDHPALRQGWHTVEAEGRAMWRWTNGRAALPIEASSGPVTIEVHLRSTGTYVVATGDTARRLAA
jgi:hypothetical protein